MDITYSVGLKTWSVGLMLDFNAELVGTSGRKAFVSLLSFFLSLIHFKR